MAKEERLEREYRTGIPQGLPTSGVLFTLYIDSVIQKLSRLQGYKLGSGKKVAVLGVMDDLFVVSGSRRGAHEAVKVAVFGLSEL